MNETVKFTFRYSENDYTRACRANWGSPSRLLFDIAVAIGLTAVGVTSWRSQGPDWFSVGFVVVPVGFILLLIAFFTVIPRLAFRREPKFGDVYSLAFSHEGIHFRTDHFDSQIQWNIYSRALVNRHSYLLYYGRRQFTVIPKRVFESPEQEQAFDRLLTAHIPKIIRRGS